MTQENGWLIPHSKYSLHTISHPKFIHSIGFKKHAHFLLLKARIWTEGKENGLFKYRTCLSPPHTFPFDTDGNISLALNRQSEALFKNSCPSRQQPLNFCEHRHSDTACTRQRNILCHQHDTTSRHHSVNVNEQRTLSLGFSDTSVQVQTVT
jgi:hypothetical protein